MNYIKISNNGLIEKEDLTLIGSSTKRGVEGKIGEFGSGNKFSIAWYLRNNCLPTIFRGTKELLVDNEVVFHRNVPVKVITVDGQPTGITNGMGPKWTGWMALRETISNAIDEEGYEIKVLNLEPTELKGKLNTTIYYIPVNQELMGVVNNFNDYFSFNREVSFSNELGEIFYKASNEATKVYRQGIKCWDTRLKFTFDVNLFDIKINESRLTSETHFDSSMEMFIKRGVDSHTMHRILSAEYKDMLPYRFSDHNLEVIKYLVSEGKRFGSSTMKKFAGIMGTMGYDYIIPQRLIDQLTSEKILTENDTVTNGYIVVDDHLHTFEIMQIVKHYNLHHVFTTFKTVVTSEFTILNRIGEVVYINTDAFEGKLSKIVYTLFNCVSLEELNREIESINI